MPVIVRNGKHINICCPGIYNEGQNAAEECSHCLRDESDVILRDENDQPLEDEDAS